MSSELVIRTVKYETGEHVALLAYGRLGPPLVESLHFNIVCYRNRGCTVATQRQVMLGLREALAFFSERNIDVIKRAAAHDFLSTDELTALLARCRKSRDEKRSRLVSGHYALMRFRICIAYVKWKAESVIDRSSGAKLRTAALKALEAFERRAQALVPGARIGDEPVSGEILGLDAAQRSLFDKAITPDDPHNPFPPEHQYRIYASLLLLRELGPRAGELLGAKISDIVYRKGETFIRIVRRPDDPEDTRKVPAVTKTNSRLLILSPELACVLDKWLTEHRTDLGRYPLARNHSYICVNHKGAALTGGGLRYILKQIEKRHPSLAHLHPHLLRHTWNDVWVESANRDGVDFDLNTRDQKYAMGWSTESKMPGRYSRRAVRDSTNRRLLKLQTSRGE